MLKLLGVILVLGFLGHGYCQHLACENRNPEGHAGVKQEGDGTFEIEVVGRQADTGTYNPNEVYTVTIKGLRTRYSIKKFLEFLLVAESEKQVMMGESGLVTTGIFHIVDDGLARFSEFCMDGVTNSNFRPKSEISVLWTAPSVLVASCITFKATVVERPHVWYMDAGKLTKTLCPYVAPPPSSTTTTTTRPTRRPESDNSQAHRDPSSKCCACDEAKYDVSFEGIWSKDTHPKDFPENKWLLHFSDIIGASHSAQFYFWETGKVASEGIRHVAEWGATRILENELKANSRHVNTIIKARGLWYPNERGQTSAAFRVDRSRHLMSLVSMIGPSPDWFVGVSGYDLCTSNCTWLEEALFDLYPYDAGTDSGITYMSPNDGTVPAGLIRRLSEKEPNDTRSPFFDTSGRPMEPLAKLVLRRQRIYPKSCESTLLPQMENHEIVVSENSEDVGRPECAVSEWSPWSECSVICGKGLRMRKRSYLIPFKADMMRCDRQLEEKEMCLGLTPTCENDEAIGGGDDEQDGGLCTVTRWSEWTPCDRSCGKGMRTRNRRYRNHMGRKKCTLEMAQMEECMGNGQDCDSGDNHPAPVELDMDPDCPVTPWSEYSPCSTTCGQGFRERTRFFLLSPSAPIPPKCLRIELTHNITCTGEYGSCIIGMEEAKEICMLEPDVGPCRFWKDEFYFSIDKGMCVPIRYGGCKGNRNRFETEIECTKVCGFLSARPIPESEGTGIQVTTQEPTTVSTTLTPEVTPMSITTESLPTETEFGTLEPSDFKPEDPEEEPVDCVTSKFSEWSLCSGDCHGTGYMTRTRDIIIEPRDGKYKPAKKCPKHLTKRKVCRVQC